MGACSSKDSSNIVIRPSIDPVEFGIFIIDVPGSFDSLFSVLSDFPSFLHSLGSFLSDFPSFLHSLGDDEDDDDDDDDDNQ
jgi:hypothetical protein